MTAFTYEQMDFAAKCMSRWMRIRWDAMSAEDKKKYSEVVTAADVDHSSLLRRLLAGKKPFKYAPPRAMSYPWYALLEEKHQMPCNAHVHPVANANSWFDFPYVNLEQGIWKIVRVEEDGAYICEWTTGHPWQVRVEPMTEDERAQRWDSWRNIGLDWCWKVTLLSDVEFMD